MRIKFTAAFDRGGDETGIVAEVAQYSHELDPSKISEHTDGLVELFRDAFDKRLGSPPCQKKVLSLEHAVEQDLATGALVWRVYVRGFMCCQPVSILAIGVLAGLAKRYFEFVDEGVKQPPTHTEFYNHPAGEEPNDEDKPERILN